MTPFQFSIEGGNQATNTAVEFSTSIVRLLTSADGTELEGDPKNTIECGTKNYIRNYVVMYL